MQIPAEFIRACRNLHQDVDLFASTPRDLVDIAIGDLSESERLVVKAFLKKTLHGLTSGVALRNVWRATGTDLRIPIADDLLLFFRLMLERLN